MPQAPAAIASEQGARLKVLALGLVTTVIWASSFVIIKLGLAYVGPISMAGYRYTLAFLMLLPIALRLDPSPPWRLKRGIWLQLALTGIAGYPIANGLLYWGLTFVSATTSSFVFNLTPFLVLLIGLVALREVPTRGQWLGFAVVAAGIAIFFALPLQEGEGLGALVTAAAALAFAWFTVQARALAKTRRMGAVTLTALPLGIGGLLLIVLALIVEGPPRWDPLAALVVFWLAAINTALANAVWMRALGSLKAFELSILMNIMPVETALIAWLATGEQFTLHKLIGIALVIPGVIFVQRATGRRGE